MSLSHAAEPPPPSPRDSGSAEELLACAKLLALSVAEHRARFGVIPLVEHAPQLDALARQPAALALPEDANAAFLEALQLVRRRLSAPTVRATGDDPLASTLNDKRRQLRISVTAPVQLSDPEQRWLLPAMIRNISWGGAAVRCKGLQGELGQRVCLHLPAGRQQKIAIVATILRIEVINDEPVFGLRFDSLSTEDEDRLQQVLRILMASSPSEGRRSEARLVQRLEIEYGDAGEFRATLEDISSSGLMLTVPEPLELNQSLLIHLSSTDSPFHLNLRARVMHQTTIGSDRLVMYRVGLRFEHPDEQLRQRVSAVIEQLATLRPTAISAVDAAAAGAESGAGAGFEHVS